MLKTQKLNKKELCEVIDTARGVKKADLVLKDVTYLDVFTGAWHFGDIAITKNRIVGVRESYEGKKEISLKGKFVVPGFIDSHVHIESTMMTPDQFQRVSLVRGTTGAVVDPHEIANVLGTKGIQYVLKCAEKSTMDLYVMLSSCVPATLHLETSGARLKAKDLLKLKDHPRVLGLAEMMNFPGLLHKDNEVIDKMLAFQGENIDGHSPFLTGKELNAYLASGIKTCHESVSLPEAREKVEKGMQVLLREGSVAKNLKDLCPVLTAFSSPKVSLCTDDRNPVDIFDEGHLDYLIRIAIEKGIAPEVAYRSASWSTANAYGIKNKGAVAPGYDADLVVVSDIQKVNVELVIKSGREIRSEKDIKKISVVAPKKNSMIYKNPKESDLKIKSASGLHRVIGVIADQIVTKNLQFEMQSQNGEIVSDTKRDILKIAVLERHGHQRKMAHGLVQGFGFQSGAIGSSVGHDSHNAVTVGTNDRDMKICFDWLKKNGGGFVAVDNGKILAGQPLPIAGLMTDQPIQKVYTQLKELRAATKQMGCKLHEPFLQLAFLCLPVIPELKITDHGLVDVIKFAQVSLKV